LPEHSRELIHRRNLTFEILTDRRNELAEQFGIRWQLPEYLREVYRAFPLDLPGFNGDDSWTVPIPSRFIIDPQGIIRSVQSDPDYTTRPEPEETLDALRSATAHR